MLVLAACAVLLVGMLMGMQGDRPMGEQPRRLQRVYLPDGVLPLSLPFCTPEDGERWAEPDHTLWLDVEQGCYVALSA